MVHVSTQTHPKQIFRDRVVKLHQSFECCCEIELRDVNLLVTDIILTFAFR